MKLTRKPQSQMKPMQCFASQHPINQRPTHGAVLDHIDAAGNPNEYYTRHLEVFKPVTYDANSKWLHLQSRCNPRAGSYYKVTLRTNSFYSEEATPSNVPTTGS